MTTQTATTLDQRVVRALGHPLRQHILRLLHEKVSSPSEIARELDESVGKIAYHVQILLETEAIELVRTQPVRGATEHFYRPLMRPFFDDEHFSQLPVASRRTLFSQTVGEIFQHVADASAAGGFDDPRTHVSWTRLELDDEAAAVLADKLAEVLDLAISLEADTANRRAGGDEGGAARRTELAMLHFDRAPAGGG